jgi:hypothetical protein
MMFTNKWSNFQINNSASLDLGETSIADDEYYGYEGNSAAVNLADGNYHIIRIVAGRNHGSSSERELTYKVWVDETGPPVISFTSPGGHMPWPNSHPSWWFGMSESNTGSKIYFDYVTGTNAGMFGPGQDDGCTSESREGDRPEITHNLTPEPGNLVTGACCLAAGASIDTNYASCIAQGGTWLGYGSVAGDWANGDWNDACPPFYCHDSWADVDQDGDVDHDDFAVFQLCYTGSGNPVSTDPHYYCPCLDQDAVPDDDIDAADFDKFQNCASGPNVPAAVPCP